LLRKLRQLPPPYANVVPIPEELLSKVRDDSEVQLDIDAHEIHVVRMIRIEIGQSSILGTIYAQLGDVRERDRHAERPQCANIASGACPYTALGAQIATHIDPTQPAVPLNSFYDCLF